MLSFKDTKMTRTCSLPSQVSEGDRLISKLAITAQCDACQEKTDVQEHRAGVKVDSLKEGKPKKKKKGEYISFIGRT